MLFRSESFTAHKQKFLPIIRSDNGKFFGFGESDVPGFDAMKGRFAEILPPKLAEPHVREVAKAMLKVKGVKMAKSANAPRLPRGRR